MDFEKTITLPSRGLFYDGALPGGEVQIKSMTTQEEKLLASPINSGTKVIDILFKRCSSLPESFPSSKLIIYDRFSLLLQIRGLSYGPIYQISFVCGECKHRNYSDVDISAMLSDEVALDDESEAISEVVLPVCGKTITWRYPTGDDELAADKQRSKFRGGSPTDLVEFRVARQIASIDGTLPQFIDVLTFIRGLAVRDNLAIRDSMAQHSFGVIEELEFTCNQCGSPTASMGLPISEDFFRMVSPNTRNR